MGWLGESLPVAVMLLLHASAAAMTTMVKLAMDGGMNPLVLVTLQQFTASAFLGPIAYFKERRSRPKFTWEIFTYLFFSAALGAALRQYMMFIGLKYTTASFTTAFSNISPVLTFLLAVATRSEALDLRTKAGMAKLHGTLISLSGAMVLTLYKGVPLTRHGGGARTAGSGSTAISSRRWTLGTVAILGNCVCISCWFLLQSRLTKKYPPVYSCNALMAMASFLQVVVVGLCTQRSVSVWALKDKFQFLIALYAGVVGCGVGFVLLTWCIEQRGPVFASAFIPVTQVIVAGIDLCILHEQFYLGSVLGSVLVIGGLYLLLWGKNKEALQLQCTTKIAEEDKEQQLVQK